MPAGLMPLEASPLGIAWSGDRLIYSSGRRIHGLDLSSADARPPAGGPEVLIELKDGELAANPQLLPDGDTLLYTVLPDTQPPNWDTGRMVAQRPGEAALTAIMEHAADAHYVESGPLGFAQSGMLLARVFDPSSLRVSADAVPVVEGVRRVTLAVGAGAVHAAVSSTAREAGRRSAASPARTAPIPR